MNRNKRFFKKNVEDYKKEVDLTINELSEKPQDLFDEWPIDVKDNQKKPWFDIYAEKLLARDPIEYFGKIKGISRDDNKPYNQKHDGAQETITSSEEDLESKSFFVYQNEFGQGDSDIFIFDYQLPIKRNNKDNGVGKVDIIGCDSEHVYLLENKRIKDPNGHILHAVIECYTYYRFLSNSFDLLAKEYSKFITKDKEFVPAIIYYENSLIFKEFHNKESNNVRALMKKLGVVPFVVKYEGKRFRDDKEALVIRNKKVFPSRKITIKQDSFD